MYRKAGLLFCIISSGSAFAQAKQSSAGSIQSILIGINWTTVIVSCLVAGLSVYYTNRYQRMRDHRLEKIKAYQKIAAEVCEWENKRRLLIERARLFMREVDVLQPQDEQRLPHRRTSRSKYADLDAVLKDHELLVQDLKGFSDALWLYMTTHMNGLALWIPKRLENQFLEYFGLSVQIISDLVADIRDPIREAPVVTLDTFKELPDLGGMHFITRDSKREKSFDALMTSLKNDLIR